MFLGLLCLTMAEKGGELTNNKKPVSIGLLLKETSCCDSIFASTCISGFWTCVAYFLFFWFSTPTWLTFPYANQSGATWKPRWAPQIRPTDEYLIGELHKWRRPTQNDDRLLWRWLRYLINASSTRLGWRSGDHSEGQVKRDIDQPKGTMHGTGSVATWSPARDDLLQFEIGSSHQLPHQSARLQLIRRDAGTANL